MYEKIKSHIPLFIILFITSGLYFLYLYIQPQLTYSFSALFDGNEYLKIYNYFTGQADGFSVMYPYNLRIQIPFLASLLSTIDPVTGFLIVNYILTILFIIIIYLFWNELKIPAEYGMAGFFWVLIHWTGIIRLNIFDPVTVDVALYLVQTLLIWIVIKKKFNWLFLLTPIAVIQKESFLALLIVLSLYYGYCFLKKEVPLMILIKVLLATFLAFVIIQVTNYIYPPNNPERNSLITILLLIRQTVLNPFRLVRWLVAIFTAFGPFIILTVYEGIKNKTLFKHNQELLVLSITYLLFGLLAGGDMTRIIFLGFPFIMTWILISLKETRGFLFKSAFVLGLPLLKIFGTIADPAVEGWTSFYKWYPEFTNPIIVLLWLGYGVMCFFIFRVIVKKLSILP